MNLPILVTNAAMAVSECAGVYAVRNTASGAAYIGAARNLRKRYRQWHKTLTSRRDANRLVLKELKTAPREEWRFIVLVHGSTMTDAELFALERRALERVQGRVLNLYPRK